jgi:NAD(P)-dependent dehydrogenase (short-subunit alcohol dehydrogenase family)
MSILDKFRLNGKKALVTGAGQGLGKAFALALAEAGADVAVADIVMENAERTAGNIRDMGRNALALKTDISKEAEVQSMVDKTVESFGKLDIAVNNAGIAIPIAPVSEVSFDAWTKQMAVNLTGTFLCAKAEAEHMKQYGYGKIINIGSMCGHIVWPEPQAAYSISKAGVIHMTKCLAAEYIKHGIRINCISPGVTRVEGLFEEVIDVYLNKAPIDRIGSPCDHQGAVVYLASELSDFMVGQELIIDGGYTLI